MDAGGPDFDGGLASGGAGSTGCFGAGIVMDAGESGFGGLASGGAGLTGCLGAEELVDTGGPGFDGKPNHTTTV
jgi:hypothetical protein